MKKVIPCACFSVLLTVGALGTGVSVGFAATQVSWTGAAGDWSDPANWDVSVVPGNDDSETFDVMIGPDAGPVVLDRDVVLDRLTLNRSELISAAGSMRSMQLENHLTWSGGTLAGMEITVGGTFSVTGGGGIPNVLDGANLTLNGESSIRSNFDIGNGGTLLNNGVFRVNVASTVAGGGTFLNNGRYESGNGSSFSIQSIWEQTPLGHLEVGSGRTLRFYNDTNWQGQIALIAPNARLEFRSVAGGATHLVNADINGTGRLDILGTSANPSIVHFGGNVFNSGGVLNVSGGAAHFDYRPTTKLGDTATVDSSGKLVLQVIHGDATDPAHNEFHIPEIRLIGHNATAEIVVPAEPPAGESPRLFRIDRIQAGSPSLGRTTFVTLGELDRSGYEVDIGEIYIKGRLTLEIDPGATHNIEGALATAEADSPIIVLSNRRSTLVGKLLLDDASDLFFFPHTALEHVRLLTFDLAIGGGSTIKGNQNAALAITDGVVEAGPPLPGNPDLPSGIDVPGSYTNVDFLIAPDTRFEVTQVELFSGVRIFVGERAEATFSSLELAEGIFHSPFLSVVLGISETNVTGDPATVTLDSQEINGVGQVHLSASVGASIPLAGTSPGSGPFIVFFASSEQHSAALSVPESRTASDFKLPAGGIDVESGTEEVSPFGTLTLTGDFHLTGAARQIIEIGGLSPGVDHDQLVFADSLTLGGTLELVLLDGIEGSIQPEDAFAIITAGELNGSFGTAANGQRLATANGKGSFIVNYGSSSPFPPHQVVLSDFAPSAPALQRPFLSPPAIDPGGTLQFLLSGNPESEYAVQTSEDLVNWSPIDVYVTGQDGTAEISINLDTLESHRFFRAVETSSGLGSVHR